MQTQEVIGVITSPDKPAGRGKEITANPFAIHAAKKNLPIFKPETHEQLHQALLELQAELVVTIAYGRLVKPAELIIPKFGWLNVHFSLLPRWRGAAPVQYALWHGDKETGVTVFQLDAGLDTGPIYSQSTTLIGEEETSETLLQRLCVLAEPALDEAFMKIKTGQTPASQSNTGESFAPKITKAEGRIEWSRSNIEIERQLRALHPWPGCWSIFNKQRVQICNAKVIDSAEGTAKTPGSIDQLETITVKCGIGSLQLLTVKPEGKREMSAAEWLRGIRDKTLRFDA